MNLAQVTGYYNQMANELDKPQVKKFKTLEEAKDKAYALAWENGLDEEAPPSGEEAKPNGKVTKKAKPAKEAKPVKEKAAKPEKEAKPAKEAKEKKPAKDVQEKGPLDTRIGTNKYKVVEILLSAKGNKVPLKSLADEVYGEDVEGSLGNVKMVLKGVAKSCEVDPHFKFSIDKENASLVAVKR
jgi:hypothetical protein